MTINRRNQRWGSDFRVTDFGNTRIKFRICWDCYDCLPFCSALANECEELMRQLMMSSMHARFGKVDALPHPIEWLMDNDRVNLSEDFREFAKALGFELIHRTIGKTPSHNSTEQELREPRIIMEAAMYTSKLTKKFFMGIPEGMYLVSNLIVSPTESVFAEMTSPLSERSEQWERIRNVGVDQRRCHVFRSKLEHERWTSSFAFAAPKPQADPELH